MRAADHRQGDVQRRECRRGLDLQGRGCPRAGRRWAGKVLQMFRAGSKPRSYMS